jgi:Holliday junction DNA helicase RuvA
MIGWISGTIREYLPGRVLIETHGVGYEIYIYSSLEQLLGRIGETAELYIHTHVREDDLMLFGFRSLAERELFQQLNMVSGIGAKTAMNVLSSLPSNRLIQAIRSGETTLLKQVPGIGKKTAERMVIELRDRLKHLSSVPAPEDAKARGGSSASEDLVSALVNLGYRRTQAETAVSQVELSKFTSFDRMLKESLKVLSK